MLKDLSDITCKDMRELEKKDFEDSILKTMSSHAVDFEYIVNTLKRRYSYSQLRQKMASMRKEGKLIKIKSGHYYTYKNANKK